LTYAIISDIHGNLPALKAALADAKAHGVDGYLLLGDYSLPPWVNEVVDIIRNLKNAIVVGGNGEGYLRNTKKQRQEELNDDQFKPVYWSYNSLTPENLDYLITLPETATITGGGCDIHLAHFIDIFYHPSIVKYTHPPDFHQMMLETPISSHEEYLTLAREAILSSPDVLAELSAISKGIYLFGHNHFQFHMEYEDKLFVNPGSCGSPINWNTAATYTLLTCKDGSWAVKERQLEYDLNIVADAFDSSGFTDYSPFWSELLKLQLHSAKNYIDSFVTHLVETGRAMGKTDYPVSKEVWDKAVKMWDASEVENGKRN